MGTGRRKESVARVFLRAGSGKFTVNGRTAEQYFPNHAWKHDATEALKFTSLADQVDVMCTVHGGGVGGQAGAVRMGLSRAISKYNARGKIDRATYKATIDIAILAADLPPDEGP